jgi:hypothetical protein
MAAKGAAQRIHIQDTVSVPTYGFITKNSKIATPIAISEKKNCRIDSPKYIDSV